MEQEALQKFSIPDLLQAMYTVRLQQGKDPWKADGDPVPADFISLPDGVLPIILRQGYEFSRAIGREDLYREGVRIEPDKNALVGSSGKILPMEISKKVLLLSILQTTFPLLDERENIMDAWEKPVNLFALEGERLLSLYRSLRVDDLFPLPQEEISFLYPENAQQDQGLAPGISRNIADTDLNIH